ncbi:MAG: sulfatase [Pirellulales bacterium]|nr:sulfatase [Pirellulales bacterium]
MAGLILATLLPAASCAQPHRPNVLFISVDDMRDWTGHLGGYEGAVVTPNIDRLAGLGVAFTNAHCASPLCGPSRLAIMSGRMPSSTGAYDNDQWWMPNLPSLATLPAYFRRQNYTVVGAGKTFHHTAGFNPPNQWDAYHPLLFRNDPWFRRNRLNYPWSESGESPPGFPFSKVSGLGVEHDWGALPIAESAHDDAASVDYALEFLARRHSKPFFLACGIFRPHLPWYVPQRYLDLYPIEKIRLPPVLAGDLADLPEAGRALAERKSEVLQKIKAAGAWQAAVRAYLASISFADAQVGRLLDGLLRSSHARNTIIVLWSDHGFHLGEKDHWAKSTLWEVSTRVPFVLVAPGVSATGKASSRPVSLVDVFPTLIDLCGLPKLAGLDGRSLTPLLRAPEAAWEWPAVIEFEPGNVAVRSDRYRYIRYRDGTEELYDHARDPHEWRNLAADPDQAGTIGELKKWLPRTWAPPLLPKSAFDFDPHSFTWTNKATGTVVSGKE